MQSVGRPVVAASGPPSSIVGPIGLGTRLACDPTMARALLAATPAGVARAP